MIHFAPGDRVTVFDPTLWKNDRDTPPNKAFKLATVVCYYGFKSEQYGNYPSLIDVVFDHDGRLSKGHFTSTVKKVKSKRRSPH